MTPRKGETLESLNAKLSLYTEALISDYDMMAKQTLVMALRRWRFMPTVEELATWFADLRSERISQKFIDACVGDSGIAAKVIEHITNVHGKATAHAWFVEAKTDDYEIISRWERNDDGSVTLHAGTNFRVEQITQRFLPTLKQALGCNVRVER